MSSNKGITLISLIMYVVAATIIIGAIASISAFFYSNAENMSKSSAALGDYSVFNLAMLKEAKTEGNRAESISEDQNSITFSSGNTYSFSNGNIYKNSAVICSNVINCKFKKEMQEEKQIITVFFESSDFAKTVQYVINDTNPILEPHID